MKIGKKLATYGAMLTFLGLAPACGESGMSLQGSDGTVADAGPDASQPDAEVPIDGAVQPTDCAACEADRKVVFLVSQELIPGNAKKLAPMVEGDAVILKLEAAGADYTFTVTKEGDGLVLVSTGAVTYQGQTGTAKVVIPTVADFGTYPSKVLLTLASGQEVELNVTMKEEARDTENKNYDSRTAVLVVANNDGKRDILLEGQSATNETPGSSMASTTSITAKVEKATDNGAFVKVTGHVGANDIGEDERAYVAEGGQLPYANGAQTAVVSLTGANDGVRVGCKEYPLVFAYNGQESEPKVVGDLIQVGSKWVKVENLVATDDSGNRPIVKVTVLTNPTDAQGQSYVLQPNEAGSTAISIGIDNHPFVLLRQEQPVPTCVPQEQTDGGTAKVDKEMKAKFAQFARTAVQQLKTAALNSARAQTKPRSC